MNTNHLEIETFPIGEIRNKALDEVGKKGKELIFCSFICNKAFEEMKSKRKNRPFSKVFYELAFFQRQEMCLTLVYKIWFPVLKKWLLHWDYGLKDQRLDDVVDELIYSTFDALFEVVLQNRFKDFEAGRVHNFFKKTLHFKVFECFRQEKRMIVSCLNRRRKNLADKHVTILKEKIFPQFEKQRPFIEVLLFDQYLLQGKDVLQIVDTDLFKNEAGMVAKPIKFIHNKIQTMLWNVYKILKSEKTFHESKEINSIFSVWLEDIALNCDFWPEKYDSVKYHRGLT